MPKVYGKEHIIFLVIYFVVAITAIVLSKLFLKSKKSQMIYLRTLAGLTLLFNLLCRIGVAIYEEPYEWFPATVCSMTSFVLPTLVLLRKENDTLYHGVFYIAIVGGIATLIYPDFISQGPSIFQLNTFMGLLHHGTLFLLALSMILFGWFQPSLKKSFVFPITICIYIAIGAFAIRKLGLEDGMLINSPIVKGTPIDCWFILLFGTVLVYFISFVYEIVYLKWYKNRKQKQ